uniref:PA domain-containing protein n=1 Tax=Caenorhabditis japonica TaxID=281687 RepID=A0A8R1EGP3_CAEJA
MAEYVEKLDKEGITNDRADRYVQFLNYPFFGKMFFACPSQFGKNLYDKEYTFGKMAKAMPFRACSKIMNAEELRGKIALVERSDCIFQLKAKMVQDAGAIGVIVIDHEPNSKFNANRPSFSMAADRDTRDDIAIGAIFVYRREGEEILKTLKKYPETVALLSSGVFKFEVLMEQFLRTGKNVEVVSYPKCPAEHNDIVHFNLDTGEVNFYVRLNGVTQESEAREHQEIVERHVIELQKYLLFSSEKHSFKFYEFFRTAAYGALDLNVDNEKWGDVLSALNAMTKKTLPQSLSQNLPGLLTRIRCVPRGLEIVCDRLA